VPVSDLSVKTHVLLSTSDELTGVSTAAHALADSHVRAAKLCPSLGFDEPAQAADSFLNSWAYGVRQIASQAEQLGRDVRTAADTFAVIEARLAREAGGAAFEPVLSAPPAAPVEEPLPMVRHWTGVIAPPMQLAHATRAEQIIPGDPEQARLLFRLVADFSDEAHHTRDLLQSRADLGGWKGAAAGAAEAELQELLDSLMKAVEAFENASGALSAYAFALDDAQAEVKQALVLWQSAIKASEVARGVAIGPTPVDAPADPDAVLARAGAMTQDALERIRVAGKTLATVLHEAKEGAPKDPSFWSHVRRAVASFGLGLVDGTVVAPIEGIVGVGKLAVALNPARAIYDPDGYVAAQEALYAGLGHVLLHPGEFGAAIVDVKGFKEDRAKWLGELLPDLLAIGAAVKAAGAAKKFETIGRYRSAGEAVAEAGGTLYTPLSPALKRELVADLGFDPGSIAGQAARARLGGPFVGMDGWEVTHLEQGQRIVMLNGGKAFVPIEEFSSDGALFYSEHQLFAERHIVDGLPSAPLVHDSVKIIEIRAPGGMDVARATVEANPQFGVGGGTQLFIPESGEAFEVEHLAEVDTRYFDPDTLESNFEDPAYRAADPDLPIHPLDPEHEKLKGYGEGLREKGLETVRDKAMTTAGAATVRAVDGSD
jgi:hypothetical protein